MTAGGADGSEAHLTLFLEIISEPDPEVRARRATEELQRLEAERGDMTAVRDVAVHKLASDGYSYTDVGRALGLGKDRGAQLVRRAKEVHGAASQHISRIRRRAARIVPPSTD